MKGILVLCLAYTALCFYVLPTDWVMTKFELSKQNLVPIDPFVIIAAVVAFSTAILIIPRFKKHKNNSVFALTLSVLSFLALIIILLIVVWWSEAGIGQINNRYVNPIIIRLTLIAIVCLGFLSAFLSAILAAEQLSWYLKAIKSILFLVFVIGAVVILEIINMGIRENPGFLYVGKDNDRVIVVKVSSHYRPSSWPYWKCVKYSVELMDSWILINSENVATTLIYNSFFYPPAHIHSLMSRWLYSLRNRQK
jgi:hypothetical protein